MQVPTRPLLDVQEVGILLHQQLQEFEEGGCGETNNIGVVTIDLAYQEASEALERIK